MKGEASPEMGKWCADEFPGISALDVPAFAEQFAARCRRHGIATQKDGNGSIVCLGLKLAKPAVRPALGHMNRRRSA